MVINYLGDNSFRVQSGKLVLITNPLPRFKGDITLYTGPRSEEVKKMWPPEPNHIYGPGEYEIQEVEISGFHNKDKSATYVAKVEEIKLCFMGEAAQDLEPGVLEKLGGVDILFVPAGVSAKVIKQVQPKIVIPSYKKPNEWKEFLKELDKKAEPEEKLVIKKKDLTPGTKAVVLKA